MHAKRAAAAHLTRRASTPYRCSPKYLLFKIDKYIFYFLYRLIKKIDRVLSVNAHFFYINI